MDQQWTVFPVGFVRSSRTEPIDDDWDSVESSIEMCAPFDERSVAGLNEFSHVDVIYLFDRVDPNDVCVDARRPRGNPDWPEVGIFAQRAKLRPNRLGLSCCRLLTVMGTTLVLQGLDAIDGTPVLDVKPHMAEFGPRQRVRQPAWSRELMQGYF